MSDHSLIEWTDATWNPITGCSVVSAGCKHCYAMKLAGTRLRKHPSRASLTIETKAGPVWNGQVRLNEDWLDQPLRWRRPRRIFVCAHGDLFHESVPFDWIDRVFAVMSLAPQHTFQVLTKRPTRMLEYMTTDPDIGRAGFVEGRARRLADIPSHLTLATSWPFRNVWLGVSVEDQAAADERIPLLLKTPAAVRWISAEPLLGPVDLCLQRPATDDDRQDLDGFCHTITTAAGAGLRWVVAGGESGHNARPMHPAWARSLRDQCVDAAVPFFFKQWGEYVSVSEVEGPGEHFMFDDGATVRRTGKKRAGRTLDGVEHNGMPRQ